MKKDEIIQKTRELIIPTEEFINFAFKKMGLENRDLTDEEERCWEKGIKVLMRLKDIMALLEEEEPHKKWSQTKINYDNKPK